MSFWQALFVNPLLIYALLAGLAASIVSGIVGSYVVVKRIAFISGSIAHAVLGGIGFALWLERAKGITWISPLTGALGMALLSAFVLGYVRLYSREREDSIIAALWSLGMATGVIFISQTPGYNVELTNYLIGNILWVTPEDLAILWGMDMVVIGTTFCLHKRFLAICFDEEQAQAQGLPIQALYILLLLLIAISVVLLIQVVGIILVMTMLILPPAMANVFTYRLSHMMIIAIFLNALFSFTGTALAYHLDWPAGATIALLTGLLYIVFISLRRPLHTLLRTKTD